MKNKFIWIAMSFAWSEIGIEGNEYEDYAKLIEAKPDEMGKFSRTVFFEVVPAFATFTVFALLSMGLIMSDWGYRDGYVVAKVRRWLKWRYLFMLNPLWWVGYPLALIMSVGHYTKLRRALRKQQASSGGFTGRMG